MPEEKENNRAFFFPPHAKNLIAICSVTFLTITAGEEEFYAGNVPFTF